MAYEFKKLSNVETVEKPAESANVLIEENGVVKKAPKDEVCGLKKLTEVETVETVGDTATVFIEEDGVIKKAAKNQVGGGEPDMVITVANNIGGGTINADCVTVTSGNYADVATKLQNGEIVDVRIIESRESTDIHNELKARCNYYYNRLFVTAVVCYFRGCGSIYAICIEIKDGNVIANATTKHVYLT